MHQEVTRLAAAELADRVDRPGRDRLACADLDDRAVADLLLIDQAIGRPSAAREQAQDIAVNDHGITSHPPW